MELIIHLFTLISSLELVKGYFMSDENKTLKRYLARKKVFTVIFIGLLFFYAGYNIYLNHDIYSSAIKHTLDNSISNRKITQGDIAGLENTLNTEVWGRMNYLETYSYYQNIMDKREISNFKYVKDETGSLHYASFFRENETDCFEYAMRVKRLKDFAEKNGTDVLFVVAPTKYVAKDSELRAGIPINNPEVIVDELLFYLNRLGIDTLDLNLYIPGKNVSYEDAFFKTDHHWTIDAAYEATKILVDEINRKYDYDLDSDKYLNDDSYHKEYYKAGMLGSMGRGSGASFSGLDDFVAYYPNFKNNYHRESFEENGEIFYKEGDTLDTIILPSVLKNNDIYSDSQYSAYLNGLRQYEKVINLDNPDGKKIFMIRDSYFSPVISFMAPLCGEIEAMWSLENRDELDIESYIRSNKFDCIIMEVYPYNINDEAFRFFMGTQE